MPTTFSSPQVPEVVIGGEDTVERMLLQLGGTILRGSIGDAFSTLRQEKVNKYNTLWAAQEQRIDDVLELSSPGGVREAIDKYKADANKIDFPEEMKEAVRLSINSLENHYTNLVSEAPGVETKIIVGGFAEAYAEATETSSKLQKDPAWLEKFLGQYDDEIDYVTTKYLLSNENFPKEEWVELQDKSPDDKLRFLSRYIRNIDEDMLLAESFEKLARERQVIAQTLNFAQKELLVSDHFLDYQIELDNLRGDRANYELKSAEMFADFRNDLSDKGQFMTEKHKLELYKMNEESRLITAAIGSLDYIENKGALFESEAAKSFIDDATEFINTGIDQERLDFISKGLGLLDDANRKEAAYQKDLFQKELALGRYMNVQKTKFEQSTKAKMMPIMKSISQKLTPKMIEEKLSGSYGQRGEFTLLPKTDQYLQGFNLETDANLKAYKSEIGVEIAKFVKSSSLKGLNDNQQEIVNDLANKARKGSFDASDKLYEILQGESKDLDFEGWGDDDKNAKEIYEQYLKLYGILYEANIDAISKFGADYGYDQIEEASALNDPFGGGDDSWMYVDD